MLDLQWCCSLAQSLGDAQTAAAADVLAANVASAGVLGQLVRRCALASPAALRPLAEAAVAAFVHAAHAKLANISPRFDYRKIYNHTSLNRSRWLNR